MHILDLPNEIQARIFYAGTKTWSDYRAQELPFTLLISSVCSHWRSLAHSTPELWTLIEPPLNKTDDACLEHTSLWLTRSRAKLISVILDSRIVYLSRDLSRMPPLQAIGSLITRLLELIMKEAHDRLRRLDVCDSAAGMAVQYLSTLRCAPQLQQLSLCLFDLRRPDQLHSSFGNAIAVTITETPVPWPPSFPSLTRVRLSGVNIPFIHTLSTLEALSLRLSYHDVQILFSTSPNLSRLSLDNLIPISSAPSSTTQRPHSLINAHSLRFITIRSEARIQEGEIYLFSLLAMPNLVSLHLDGGGAVSIASIFGSSLNSAPIETLRVTCSQATFMGIPERNAHMKAFRSLSTLQNLQVIHGPVEFLSTRSDNAYRRTRTRSIQGQIDPRAAAIRPVLAPPIGIPQQLLQRRLAPPGNDDIKETQNLHWPNLHTIQFDSLLATDVSSLCEFVTKRRGVRTVELSHSAARHLSESLLRKGNSVYAIPWRAASNGIENIREGTKDVRQWLAGQVTLRILRSSDEYERLNSRGIGILLTEMI